MGGGVLGSQHGRILREVPFYREWRERFITLPCLKKRNLLLYQRTSGAHYRGERLYDESF